MVGSGVSIIGNSGDHDPDIRIQLESLLQQNQNNATAPSLSPNKDRTAREIGGDLAETQLTEAMSLSNQFNSILERLAINKTGEFADTTDELKFKVNQEYLDEKGFLIVQKDLLTLNQAIQEALSSSEHTLNYKIEIDPTRNVVNFKPNTEFKYAPEIINIKNIPKAYSPNEGIFEDYPINTLIPVLVGPPPLDYLRKTNGEKSTKFAGIEDGAFKALEKATKQEDHYKTDFHLAHALNIAMLPNAKWVIIDDNQVIDRLGFPTNQFRELLSPELVMNSRDMWNLKIGENHKQTFYDTPLTPPSIRRLLPKLAIQVRQHPTQGEGRFITTESKTALAPNLAPYIDTASFHHLVQYFNQHALLQQAGQIDQGMPPLNKGFLCTINGSPIGPVAPKKSK
jgi:hypothetical protein